MIYVAIFGSYNFGYVDKYINLHYHIYNNNYKKIIDVYNFTRNT